MEDILKGNFKVKKEVKKSEKEMAESLESAFEKDALEKLGGSIAFVKKSTSFVWKGDKKK